MNISKVSEIAAKWWADFLRQPKELDDLGSDPASKALAKNVGFLKGLINETNSREVIDRFEVALCEIIKANLKKESDSRSPVFLGVDYHPDAMLNDAADLAGANIEVSLPCKTRMWVYQDHVDVVHGYGAEKAVLYADEG